MVRRVRRLSACGILMLTLSCSGEPTAPDFGSPPPSPPPRWDVTGGGDGGKEGTVPLPIPINNVGSGFGRVYPFPVVDYAAGDFVRIQIDGLIVTQINWECIEKEYPIWWAGGAWGPWGSPNGEFVASAYYDASHPMATDPAGIGTSRKVAFGYFDSPGTAYAGRLGGGGLCPLPGLLFSGEQTVQYEVYPAAGVSASKTFVVRGDSTAASADSHWDITSPAWLFQPNDTTPSAKGTHFGQQVCAGALSCAWAPTVSGRIYLTGQVMGVPVNATGPIIWVRDSVPEVCTPAPPPGSYESQGTAGPGCPPPEDPPPAEPDSTLVVTVSLSRTEVMPVLDRNFNAVTQFWSDTATGQRTDTVEVVVQAHFEPSGTPAVGADVQFLIEPVEGSGGHQKPHPPDSATAVRPPGRWFGLSETDSLFEKLQFDHRKALSRTTGSDGTAKVYYRTSGVGGLDGLRAVVSAGGFSTEGVDTVLIRFPGLVQVARSGTGYVFEPETNNSHAPEENYLADGVIEILEGIWAEYIACSQATPNACPMSGSRFTITAASVVNGGLLDVARNWRTPNHMFHRQGRDVDFDDDAAETGESRELLKICMKARYTFEGVSTTCENEGNHFHAYVGRTHYHR